MPCVVIRQPLEAAIMRLMYSIVAAEQQWKSGGEKPDRGAEQ